MDRAPERPKTPTINLFIHKQFCRGKWAVRTQTFLMTMLYNYITLCYETSAVETGREFSLSRLNTKLDYAIRFAALGGLSEWQTTSGDRLQERCARGTGCSLVSQPVD